MTVSQYTRKDATVGTVEPRNNEIPLHVGDFRNHGIKCSLTYQTGAWSVYWLRFATVSADLDALLKGNGWSYVVRRDGYHRELNAQSEAFISANLVKIDGRTLPTQAKPDAKPAKADKPDKTPYSGSKRAKSDKPDAKPKADATDLDAYKTGFKLGALHKLQGGAIFDDKPHATVQEAIARVGYTDAYGQESNEMPNAFDQAAADKSIAWAIANFAKQSSPEDKPSGTRVADMTDAQIVATIAKLTAELQRRLAK